MPSVALQQPIGVQTIDQRMCIADTQIVCYHWQSTQTTCTTTRLEHNSPNNFLSLVLYSYSGSADTSTVESTITIHYQNGPMAIFVITRWRNMAILQNHQRWYKVQQLTYDSPLVFHSNYGSILRCFWDIPSYCIEITQIRSTTPGDTMSIPVSFHGPSQIWQR